MLSPPMRVAMPVTHQLELLSAPFPGLRDYLVSLQLSIQPAQRPGGVENRGGPPFPAVAPEA